MVIIWCLLRYYIKIEHYVVQKNARDIQTPVGTCHCKIYVKIMSWFDSHYLF